MQWPQGKGAEVEGLDALAAKVKATPGAIGYGGVTTVKTNGFTSVSLKNRAGEFVKADHASFTKAAEAEDWSVPGFNVDLVDEAAAGAWPILGANFALVPENPTAQKVDAARNTFKFFDWRFDHGFAAAHEIGYEGPEQRDRCGGTGLAPRQGPQRAPDLGNLSGRRLRRGAPGRKRRCGPRLWPRGCSAATTAPAEWCSPDEKRRSGKSGIRAGDADGRAALPRTARQRRRALSTRRRLADARNDGWRTTASV